MKKFTWIRVSRLAFALWLLPSALCQAQTQTPPADTAATIQAELARINQSMAQLVALLREVMERQNLDILLKRIELHYSALAPVQEDLRAAQAEKRSLEDEQMRLLNAYNELAEQAEQGDTEIATSAAGRKAIRRELEAQLKLVKGRLATAEQRVAELENELTEGRRKIEVLEGTIDDRLRSSGR